MIDKILQHKKLFFVATLLVPILCIVIGLQFIQWCSITFISENPIVIIDPTQKISTVDIMSLYLSILGIIVGAYITIAIFYLQTREEKNKLQNVMEYYQIEIINSLNKVFNKSYDDISLNIEHWIEVSSQIKDMIGEEKFSIINELCIEICNSRTTRKNDFLEKYYIDFYKYYRKYINKSDFFIQSFLSTNVLIPLEALGKKKYINNAIVTKNNILFCKLIHKDNSIIYKCNTNDIKCECSFKNGLPWNGYVRQNSKLLYDGELREGKKNGNGRVLYGVHLLEEGTYQNDILINGKIYGLEIISDSKTTKLMGLIFENLKPKHCYKDFEPLSCENDEKFTQTLQIADYQVVNGFKSLIPNSKREVKVIDDIAKINAEIKNIKKGISIPTLKY